MIGLQGASKSKIKRPNTKTAISQKMREYFVTDLREDGLQSAEPPDTCRGLAGLATRAESAVCT